MTKREQAARLTVGLMKKGLSLPEIEEEVGRKLKVYGAFFRKQVLTDAYKAFEKMEVTEKQKLYDLHMNRYERHYRKAKKNLDGFSEFYNAEQYERWMSNMNASLNALKGKEIMMGFHEKDFKITINNNEVIVTQKSHGNAPRLYHQISKLDQDELIELRELLVDARIKDVDGIWPTRKVKPQEAVQDIEYVEVEEVEEDDMPDNVIKEMQKEVDLEPNEDYPNPEILDNITKAIQQKSQQQLLDAINKKKEKKLEVKKEAKTTKIVKPKKKKK